ncbi:MAG: tRNA (guanosine(37)-N1)-methyltransferase TrmD [Chloroflexi bacterium]|nr:tRNA (guanosine(37)-N1)-methyltransferase TrmD [Chloroflexota bacterium]
MRLHIVTIFPEMFPAPLGAGIVGRAQEAGLAAVHVHDLRDFAHDRRRTTDDSPFGGGPGMVMRPEPLYEAVESLQLPEGSPVVALTPQGAPFRQADAERLAAEPVVTLLCGRYDGVDERVVAGLATERLSIGDYVLTGGELAAMVVVDAVVRLLPGALGHAEEAIADDSFTSGLLQYPQYTRPADYRGMSVPEVLLSGDHAAIDRWRRNQALRRTLELRPDLLAQATLSDEDRKELRRLGWSEN